jgi:hypothetical protein
MEQFPRLPHDRRLQRADGNLGYLDFIRMVETLWRESHPEIPFLAKGGPQETIYPAILYSLQLRKAHPSEPKPRYREEVKGSPDEDAIIICAQRFQNVVNFSVVDKDPRMAEELIEVFEDFMLEFIPVFKERGISELVYARRLPDDEERRPGEDVVWRTVAYLVTTEKLRTTTVSKLNNFTLRARLAIRQEPPFFTANPDADTLTVYGMSLMEGDAVQLAAKGEEDFPEGLSADAIYTVLLATETNNGWQYVLTTEDAPWLGVNPVDITTTGTGLINLVPPTDQITVVMEDDQQTPVSVP